jgi:DNA segregation ATPase FtsK/SpoIIIE-like protein
MVSGSTGSGKSYFLRSLAYQLISLPATQTVMLYLADRAGNVFTPLDAYQVPQLAAPVAKTPNAVAELLERVISELRRREALFDAQIQHFPDKLDEYNRIPGVERLPRAVVILDEVTVLVAETDGERGFVHHALLTLAAQGRKYGFTLVVAGQDFKTTTFNTALTHQLSTRVAFKAGSGYESRVVLGVDGAEKLRGAGHGLLRHAGKLVEFQGFAVSKDVLVARCAEIGVPLTPKSALSKEEISWVIWALDNLVSEHGAAFTKNRLTEHFGNAFQYAIWKTSRRWEQEGLLVKERRGDNTNEQWWITPKLAQMARASLDTQSADK